MIYAKRIKRILDFALSSFALLLFSPVFMILTVVGFFAVKGNPFFTRDAEGNLLPDEMRLNSYGRFLRATSLDELPELLNIWKGDMAIVGPRPLLTRYLPFYTETERKRHTVRPGLTGLAQISGRNALAWDSRLALDVKYAEHITFLGDVKIILMTVVKVIKREDVVDAGSFEMLDLDQERKSSVADHKSNP